MLIFQQLVYVNIIILKFNFKDYRYISSHFFLFDSRSVNVRSIEAKINKNVLSQLINCKYYVC